MKVVNLLEFLNNSSDLYTLDYATCDNNLVNFLDLVIEEEQFTQKINLGIFYIYQTTLRKFIIVDGLNRLLSLSLLLHAICECYKKTSEKNDKAIKTIREKYLVSGERTKLRLNNKHQEIYQKIIFGERLSGKEKNSPMFILLHNFWSQIKEENLSAASIFAMLNKIIVTIADAQDIELRELYYILNRHQRSIKQLPLVKDYLISNDLGAEWDKFTKIFKNTPDTLLFFKDFFVTKFNFKHFNPDRLYENFTNYFETMLQYKSKQDIMSALLRTAKLYKNILNVNFTDDNIKKAFIQLKINNGEDTFAYILNIYEDYIDNRISYTTFLEILATINEYLNNRHKTNNNIAFNELIEYLNAFITCK